MQRILSTMISEHMKARRYMMIRKEDCDALDEGLEGNMRVKELLQLLRDALDRAEEYVEKCSRCGHKIHDGERCGRSVEADGYLVDICPCEG